jgi:hypothetical protein
METYSPSDSFRKTHQSPYFSKPAGFSFYKQAAVPLDDEVDTQYEGENQ